mmetsp:Transcript_5376/g.16223  ORF Transcript_5376/g.16223 Transcript_5376/m.16223 type:complete len:411 (+) Transcript_5376:2094-3326(+)
MHAGAAFAFPRASLLPEGRQLAPRQRDPVCLRNLLQYALRLVHLADRQVVPRRLRHVPPQHGHDAHRDRNDSEDPPPLDVLLSREGVRDDGGYEQRGDDAHGPHQDNVRPPLLGGQELEEYRVVHRKHPPDTESCQKPESKQNGVVRREGREETPDERHPHREGKRYQSPEPVRNVSPEHRAGRHPDERRRAKQAVLDSREPHVLFYCGRDEADDHKLCYLRKVTDAAKHEKLPVEPPKTHVLHGVVEGVPPIQAPLVKLAFLIFIVFQHILLARASVGPRQQPHRVPLHLLLGLHRLELPSTHSSEAKEGPARRGVKPFDKSGSSREWSLILRERATRSFPLCLPQPRPSAFTRGWERDRVVFSPDTNANANVSRSVGNAKPARERERARRRRSAVLLQPPHLRRRHLT